jgi:type IV pilus assembly protein PilB
VVSRLKILAGMSIVERRRPQDGQFTIQVDGRPIDVRVASAPMVFGEKLVLRLLDQTRAAFTLSDLGMTGETLRRFRRMLATPYGMILCAGPTGSGKTTTLYSALNEINTPDRNVTTIEDPVEYVFPSVSQMQINEAVGVTFSTGLRSILRQDPDMILVGEIRDLETASIAVQASLTGHFVMSSIHATDAVSSLYRLIDMGVERFLVSAALLGVIGQRLVRRNCRHCSAPYDPPPDEVRYFRGIGGARTGTFKRGSGCTYCSETGFSGRVGVYELLEISSEMRELIVRDGVSHGDIEAQARRDGLRTMGAAGAALVEAGLTTVSEVIRSVHTR